MSRPPRWLKCPRKSLIIAGRFIAFKTFLDDKFDSQVPDEYKFQFPMLQAYANSNNFELGLIIDLTNTSRFYDKNVITQENVDYCKLQCKGHGETPSADQRQRFNRICFNFFERNPNKIIGVHCTHGFNRTGFLIVSYLVEVEDWSVEAAVSHFAECRPPGIYKGHYLRKLFEICGGGAEDAPPGPDLPDWCFEDEDGMSENDDGDDDLKRENGFSDGTQRRRKEHHVKNPKFAIELLGVYPVTSPEIERLQVICADMCEWNRSNFCGSQPVSMDKTNLQYLNEKPYKVSWKADGTRYLMMILGKEEIYMFDRDNSCFAVPGLTFPCRKNPDQHLQNTLIDGELVQDKEGEILHPRYLAYDIIKFQGEDVGKADLDRRHLCIGKEIIGPRNQAAQEGRLDKTIEPFSMRQKNFYGAEHAHWLMTEFMPKLTHETDGLIFQPAKDQYTPGQSNFVLKWKPHELNSVDFLLKITVTQREGCLRERVGALFVQGLDVPFSQMNVTNELKQYDKRIIECTWDGKQWKFLRVREDKTFPNAYRTAQSVCESIRNPVTKEYLLDYIKRHGYHVEHRQNRLKRKAET